MSITQERLWIRAAALLKRPYPLGDTAFFSLARSPSRDCERGVAIHCFIALRFSALVSPSWASYLFLRRQK